MLLLVLCYAAFRAGRATAPGIAFETVRTDTVTVHDTIRRDSLVYVAEKVVSRILVPVTDTLVLHDTTYVVLERTQREYGDTLFRAWVSGYQPELDSIHLFHRTEYVTVTARERPRRWHLGVSAGYGAGKDGLSPYIGIGVTYSLLGF